VAHASPRSISTAARPDNPCPPLLPATPARHSRLQSFHNTDDFAKVVSIFHKLESLVKVRLLIACALAPGADRAKHSSELQNLADQACTDDDEWVRARAARRPPEPGS
jgi:hypothetical protein